MKYAILTFGCRVNQADSFEIEESLRARGGAGGLRGGRRPRGREHLHRDGRRRPGRPQPHPPRRPRATRRARIIVTGCYATREPGRHGVDAECRAARGELRQGAARSRELRGARRPAKARAGPQLEPGVMGRTAYPLRVQTGCEEHCAFCVIPSTRGASRSRPVAEVLGEVGRLALAGYKEVWLVGVHLGSYGRDLQPPASLARSAACPGRRARRRVVPDQFARADGLFAGRGGPGGPVRTVRAALPSAPAARQRPDARRDAAAVHGGLSTGASSRTSARACRTRRSAPT